LHEPERFDQTTGLLTKAAVRQELGGQISRSRRYYNPLSIIVIRVPPLISSQEMVAELERQRTVRSISRMLREKLRWVDIVGCWGRNEFLLVLPETGVEAATNLAEKISRQVERLKSLHSADDEPPPRVVIGVSEWRRGDDPKKLVTRVERELHSHDPELGLTVAVI
jgi:diguanylate cyclase (GGDEF)-like protein